MLSVFAVSDLESGHWPSRSRRSGRILAPNHMGDRWRSLRTTAFHRRLTESSRPPVTSVRKSTARYWPEERLSSRDRSSGACTNVLTGSPRLPSNAPFSLRYHRIQIGRGLLTRVRFN